MNGPELYPMSSVNVIPTTKPHGIYFALRYLYESYDDVIDPWAEAKPKADYDLDSIDSMINQAWQTVPSKFRYGEK